MTCFSRWFLPTYGILIQLATDSERTLAIKASITAFNILFERKQPTQGWVDVFCFFAAWKLYYSRQKRQRQCELQNKFKVLLKWVAVQRWNRPGEVPPPPLLFPLLVHEAERLAEVPADVLYGEAEVGEEQVGHEPDGDLAEEGAVQVGAGKVNFHLFILSRHNFQSWAFAVFQFSFKVTSNPISLHKY